MSRWLPDNFGGKSYKTIPSSSIQATPVVKQQVFSTEYELDFTKASKDYWMKKVSEVYEDYNKGCAVGKFGKYSCDLEDFFNRLFVLIRESITAEMSKKGYTSEQLQHQFTIIETSFKILVEMIKTIDKDKKLNVDSLCAFLHGFTNGYIEMFSKVKEKQV